MEQLKAKQKLTPPAIKPTPPASPPADGPDEAAVQANLAKLNPADRALAQAQKFCPVTGERLGNPAMGVPVKITIKGKPVFLC